VIERLEEAGFAVDKIKDSKNIKITQTGAGTVAAILDTLTAPREVFINAIWKSGKAPTGPTLDAYQYDGGMYSPHGKHFADSGFASGIYQGIIGGIPKLGADG